MNKTLKTGKKALSLVLSVLMLMSCFVFAPVVNAEGENLEVTIKCTNDLPLKSLDHPDNKFARVIVKTADGAEQIIGDLLKSTIMDGSTIQKNRSATFKCNITSKISRIYIHFAVETASLNGCDVKFETTVTLNGKKIIGPETKFIGSNRGKFKDQDGDGGKEHNIVSHKALKDAKYPTYEVKFYDLDGNNIKTQKVAFGESASAPALPSKAPDETYHYTVGWTTDAWKKVTSDLKVETAVKAIEHRFGEVTVHEPTCMVNEYTTYKCSDCGYETNVTKNNSALGHDYGGSWLDNRDGTHTGICQRPGCETTATEHTKTEDHDLKIVAAKASTCIEKGWDEYEYCNKCDYSTQKENALDSNNHVGPYEDIAAVAATCEEDGKTAGKKCTACGNITEGVQPVNKLGHNYVGNFDEETDRPSATKKGVATYVCTNDATHKYTLDMDLADYTAFDASLDALKELAKNDLNDANAQLVADLIAKGNALPRNLIAGEKGPHEPWTEKNNDQYKHDFGEQGEIDNLQDDIDALIKNIEDAGDGAYNPYTATFKAKKTNETGRENAAVKYTYNEITYTMASNASVFNAVGVPEPYQEGDYTYTFYAWDVVPSIVKGGETYTATYTRGEKEYADYADFDVQRNRATAVLNNPEVEQTVKGHIYILVKAGYENNVLGDKYGITNQKVVDDAEEELRKYLNGLYKDGVIDEENLKHYTIRFLDEDGEVLEVYSLVKGATVTEPANPTKAADEHHTYKFKDWSPAVVAVTGDQDYTATYDSIDYTRYDEIVKILDEADLDDDAKKILDDAKNQIDDDRIADPEDKNTQEEVNKVVEELEKLLDGDNVKDENLKKYKITFIYATGALDDNDEVELTSDEKRYKKGDTIVVPEILKHFEHKTADFDRTYVFTGWDTADGNVAETVTEDDTYNAKYKEVEYKDFNELVEDVAELDLNQDTKDTIADIVKGITDNKNAVDGDKNIQDDVEDAIRDIKDLIYKEDEKTVKDEVLNTYTIVFKYRIADGTETEESVSVVSGKGSEAPADFAENCHDADYHYLNGEWDRNDYNCVNNANADENKELVVTAEYETAAHNFDGGKVTTRPEPVEGAKGVVTYTCTESKCGYSYTEEVDRADYKEYDKAVQRLLDISNNYDLTEKVKQEISELLEQWKVERNLVTKDEAAFDEQEEVKKATKALNDYIVNIEKKIANEDEAVIKHYTIVFSWQTGRSENQYVKGETVVVPTVSDYDEGGFRHEFIKWTPAVVVVVADNATYTAVYTQPRNMDDVKDAIRKAEDVINNDDYYDEDQKKVEEAKEELEKYLDEKGVDLDNGQNPIKQGSDEDKKITELVEKLNEAINNANTNKAARDKNKKNTGGFMGWLTRLLILVKHLLGMV